MSWLQFKKNDAGKDCEVLFVLLWRG